MATKGGRLIKLIVVLAALGAGAYFLLDQRKQQSSANVLAQMIAMVDDMQLSSEHTDDVKNAVRASHEQAFDRALDLSRQHGKKFDEKLYFEDLVIIASNKLRDDGKVDLADTFTREAKTFNLEVTER